MKFCPSCGRQTDDHVRFCPGCGAPFPVMETRNPDTGRKPAPKKAKKKKKSAAPRVILALVFVLLIAGGVFWLLTTLGGNTPEKDDPEDETTEAEQISIAAKQFTCRETAFEVTGGEVTTLIFAVFDEELDTTGLELYAQCGSDGEKITMTDDGRGADTIAGDNVFYGMITLSAGEEGSVTYVLKTDDDIYDLRASKTSVRFYTMDTYYEEYRSIEDLWDEMDSIVAEAGYTGSVESDEEGFAAAVQALKDYLEDQVRAEVIVDYEYTYPNFLIRCELGEYLYEMDTGIEGFETGSSDAESAGTYYEYYLADADLSMLLMLPYDNDLGASAFRNAMRSISGAELGYAEADVRSFSEVNYDLLKNLESYRVIAINTHGGCNPSRGSYFSTGLSADTISEEDHTNWRVIPSSKGKALVTPYFFMHYYEDGALNDCLFYLGCCHGADNDLMANILRIKGANTVMAFEHSVSSTYDGNMVQAIFASLTVTDTDDRTQTASYAVQQAREALGDQDPTEYDGEHAVLRMYPADSTFRLISDTAAGTISGKVVEASDGSTPIPYARITLSGPDGYSRSFYTDSNGEYTYSLPSGTYVITVSCDEYHPLTFYTQVYVNYTTYLETLLMIVDDETETGEAMGIVTSAMTGDGLSDVTLTIREGWNNISEGDVLMTLSTDTYGGYYVEMPVGNYTVYCEKDGYVSNWFNIVVQSGTTGNQNGSMNVDIDGDQFRIVLTWGEHPSDVDIHIQGPKSNGGTFHTYWSSMAYKEGDLVVCSLDVDDRYSYGPETITLITMDSDDPYYCYIHRYSGSGTLSTSDANVAVYCGAQLVASFSVPTNGGSGDYWNVFAIVDGRIMLKNTITSSADLDYAD